MKIKVGDKVKYMKHTTCGISYGVVVKITCDKFSPAVYYSILDDRDNSLRCLLGWSCNIFPHLGETIELDITRMRDEKLDGLIYE